MLLEVHFDESWKERGKASWKGKRRQKKTSVDRYCLRSTHAFWWTLKEKKKSESKGKTKTKARKCGQVLLAFDACVLMKVQRKEERPVGREMEDESAQVWIGIACIWRIHFNESWKERGKARWKRKERWKHTSADIALMPMHTVRFYRCIFTIPYRVVLPRTHSFKCVGSHITILSHQLKHVVVKSYWRRDILHCCVRLCIGKKYWHLITRHVNSN